MTGSHFNHVCYWCVSNINANTWHVSWHMLHLYGGSKVRMCDMPQVLIDERLPENADRLGRILRSELAAIPSPRLAGVRGKGMLNAIIINHIDGVTAWDICLRLRNNGLLAKPTQGNVIRLAPPLVMTEAQLHECIAIIRQTIMSFDK